MVCISCIVIPVCLWLWHRFLQPFVYNLFGWAQVENKTESTIEGEKAKLTCPMSKSNEAPQDQGNLLMGIVSWSDVAESLLQKIFVEQVLVIILN